MRKLSLFLVLGLLAIAMAACASPEAPGDAPQASDPPVAEEPVAEEPVAEEPVNDPPAQDEPVTEEPPPDEPSAPADGPQIMETPQGVKYIIDPSKIIGGGPPKDGIPSIDNPKYVPLEEADRWIRDDELVLTTIYKGVTRVYPLQIMVWHEIVNDVIAGDPLLITY